MEGMPMRQIEGPQPSDSIIEVKRIKIKAGRIDRKEKRQNKRISIQWSETQRDTGEREHTPNPKAWTIVSSHEESSAAQAFWPSLATVLNFSLEDLEVGQRWSFAYLVLVETNHHDRLQLEKLHDKCPRPSLFPLHTHDYCFLFGRYRFHPPSLERKIPSRTVSHHLKHERMTFSQRIVMGRELEVAPTCVATNNWEEARQSQKRRSRPQALLILALEGSPCQVGTDSCHLFFLRGYCFGKGFISTDDYLWMNSSLC